MTRDQKPVKSLVGESLYPLRTLVRCVGCFRLQIVDIADWRDALVIERHGILCRPCHWQEDDARNWTDEEKEESP